MRVTYAIKFEDFRALFPPYTTRAGHNAGFKGAVVACALMGLLGVYCLAQGFGIALGGFLIGLGVVAAASTYFLDVRSVRKVREKYEASLSAAYQQTHCREGRTFEAGEKGFTFTCKCGALTQPWSELAMFSETKTHFFLGTQRDRQ